MWSVIVACTSVLLVLRVVRASAWANVASVDCACVSAAERKSGAHQFGYDRKRAQFHGRQELKDMHPHFERQV